MFKNLTEKFHQIFSGLSGKKALSEENIAEAVREVRLALLDADVSYPIVSQFVRKVKEKALGEAVTKTVTPHEQFIKIVHEELVALMGTEEAQLNLKGNPAVWMLCGLQGSGKTTQSAKLAAFLMKKEFNKRPLLVACDLQRPAAVEQLKQLGAQIGVPVFVLEGEKNPVKVAKAAFAHAKENGFDLLILDTAGRLHLDEPLMRELEEIKEAVSPQEILFVANGSIGQEAAKTAAEFDKRLAVTGTILTMLDGSARAGAALSIREMTGKPLKFEGIGEKIGDLQPFNPESMADRILGMGDVINLVRKAEEHFDEEESKKLEKKLKKASFTYDDYLKQMGMMKKMGPLKSLMKMLPGVEEMMGEVDLEQSENEFRRIEAIISSMTPEERQEKVDLVPSRRRRLAQGSGTTIDEVNRMAKDFKRLKQLGKEMPNLMKKENSLWR